MLLSLHIGFSFVRATVAYAILERTSSLKNCSKVLKTCHCSKLLFFNLDLPLDAIDAVCRYFCLLALISILYRVQVLSELSTRASSFCPSSAKASMPSANRRLLIAVPLPPMLTFPSGFSRYNPFEKSVGEIRQPCINPTVVLNHCPMLPFI